MDQNQEFLSSSQCFIVYDKSTRKIALSIRNRLSKEHIKCTAWDGDTFKQNEARMSNFNRVLILDNDIAKDYLSNPEIMKEISSHVIYRREGRVASLSIANDGIKYDELYEQLKDTTNKLQQISEEDKNVLLSATPEEIEELCLTNNVVCLPTSVSSSPDISPEEKKRKDKLKSSLKAAVTGVGIGAAVAFSELTIPLFTALLIVGLSDIKKSSERGKEILLFASALEFEKNYIKDFVNAE